MQSTAILHPMLLLVVLTLTVLAWMYTVRLRFIARHGIDPQALDERRNAKPILAPASRPADHLDNLLELPPLFYLAVLLIWLLQLTDTVYLTLTWSYAVLRLIHSIIHLSYNRVMHRFLAFITSCLVLVAIWLRLVLHITGL